MTGALVSSTHACFSEPEIVESCREPSFIAAAERNSNEQ